MEITFYYAVDKISRVFECAAMPNFDCKFLLSILNSGKIFEREICSSHSVANSVTQNLTKITSTMRLGKR